MASINLVTGFCCVFSSSLDISFLWWYLLSSRRTHDEHTTSSRRYIDGLCQWLVLLCVCLSSEVACLSDDVLMSLPLLVVSSSLFSSFESPLSCLCHASLGGDPSNRSVTSSRDNVSSLCDHFTITRGRHLLFENIPSIRLRSPHSGSAWNCKRHSRLQAVISSLSFQNRADVLMHLQQKEKRCSLYSETWIEKMTWDET